MVIQKHPPMTIKDLEEKVDPKRDPGPLSYIQGQDKGPITSSKKRKLFSPESKRFLFPVMVSMVFSLFIVSQMAPSKVNFNTLVGMVNSNTAAVTSSENSNKALGAKVETIITSSAQYARRSEIQDLKAQIEALKSQIEKLKN